jgi:hypothetical protein
MKLSYISQTVLAMCFTVVLATTASAQGSANGATPENGNGGQTPAATQPTAGSQVSTTPRGSWEPMGGFDLDSHSTGYGWAGPQYTHRLRDNLALTARASLNYLFYEFDNGDGRTKVNGPGFNTQVGLKVGGTNWFKVAAGPSWKRRNQQFERVDGTEIDQGGEWHSGVNFGGDVWLVPTNRVNIMGQVSHATDDSFTWSRLMGRRQITNMGWTNTFTHYLGGELIGMGNEDFKAVQIGGILEFLHVRSSATIGLRGGWKHSSYRGDGKDGPYFGIGYWQRIE